MQGIASLPIQPPTNNLIPMGGLYNVRSAADMLAEFGREGDTFIVHAAEGETVIPAEVLESNPRMKAMIFKQMEEMGLDPERYIVGNELNSINPITGQPEFFFKKLFKSVKKLVKKAAPIVLPLAAPFILPAMPAFLASGIGSFVAAKVGGASTKDALKGAVISAALSGASRAATGGKFTGSVSDPQGGLGALKSPEAFRPVNPFGGGGGGGSQNIFQDLVYDSAPNQAIPSTSPEGIASVTTTGEGKLESLLSPSRVSIQPATKYAEGAANVKNLVKEGVISPEAGKQAIDKLAVEFATSEGPGILTQFGPLAAAGLGITALTQKPEEEPPVEEFETGSDILQRDVNYQFGFDPDVFFGDNPFYTNERDLLDRPRPVTVAQGGEIVGPGTPTSDSIPAMLSDGEFVMNAKAVRGAGKGDREKGAKKMYSMMRQFERMA